MRVPDELVGCLVRRTSFDYQVRLDLADQPAGGPPRVQAELVLETSFTLRDAAGRTHRLTPGEGAALAPVLALFAQAVTAVELCHATLRLDFDSGAMLLAGPDPDYESWWLTGYGVEPIVIGPGGV